MPLGTQASIFGARPKPGESGRVAAGRASSIKIGDDGCGSLISTGGMAPSRMVDVSPSVIFPCTMKSRRSLFLLSPAHPVCLRKGAVKRFLCVCMKFTSKTAAKLANMVHAYLLHFAMTGRTRL